MHFPIASLVPLGQLESFGIPGYLAQTIEDDVLRDGQVIRGVNRFTLMNDNRIAVERVSMENEEARKTNICAAALDSLKEEKNE